MTLEKIQGDSLILETLNDLAEEKLLVEEAFDIMQSIFDENLKAFSANKNVHNAGRISELIAAKIIPHPHNNPLIQMTLSSLSKGKPIKFTEEPDFSKAISRGCAVLLDRIIDENISPEINKGSKKLLEYIESTGDLPRPEEIIEY